MGKKTWLPGKTLSRFITANFGMPEKEQRVKVERISDAVAHTAGNSREDGQLGWLQGRGQADTGGVEGGHELTAGFPDAQPEHVEVEPSLRGHL